MRRGKDVRIWTVIRCGKDVRIWLVLKEGICVRRNNTNSRMIRGLNGIEGGIQTCRRLSVTAYSRSEYLHGSVKT